MSVLVIMATVSILALILMDHLNAVVEMAAEIVQSQVSLKSKFLSVMVMNGSIFLYCTYLCEHWWLRIVI